LSQAARLEIHLKSPRCVAGLLRSGGEGFIARCGRSARRA
jgi:hypothetical protein